jgi:hypothetical protein
MFNAGASDADFCLPPLPKGSRWHLAVDTSRPTPQDLFVGGAEELLDHSQPFRLPARSSAICLARERTSVSAPNAARVQGAA